MGRWRHFSVEDLMQYFVGCARLLQATFIAAHKTFRDTVASECPGASRCKQAQQWLLQYTVDTETFAASLSSPLHWHFVEVEMWKEEDQGQCRPSRGGDRAIRDPC